MTFPYGYTPDPSALGAFLIGAALVGLILGAVAVAITAVARR